MSEPKMWIGLHTGPPKIEYDDYGLRQRTTDAFARVNVTEGEIDTWTSPTETLPVAVDLGEGRFYGLTITTGGDTVTNLGLADAPTGGSLRHLAPTGETLVDGEGVTRQVWREVLDPEDEQ